MNETNGQKEQLQRYLEKLGERVLHGESGKPGPKRYRGSGAKFNRTAQARHTAEKVRAAQWATLRGGVLSVSEFAALAGQTPAEAVQRAIDVAMFARGRRKA
jgi:hypothetical protein